MALIFRPFLPITLPMRLWEMRRRIAVGEEDAVDVTGEDGLVETSWETMRAYAYMHGHSLENSLGQKGDTYLCHTLHGTGHGENALVNARNDLADACFDAGLFPKFCDIFSALANDDAGFLGAHESAESQGVSAGRRGGTGLGSGAWMDVNQEMGERAGWRGNAHRCRGERERQMA